MLLLRELVSVLLEVLLALGNVVALLVQRLLGAPGTDVEALVVIPPMGHTSSGRD